MAHTSGSRDQCYNLNSIQKCLVLNGWMLHTSFEYFTSLHFTVYVNEFFVGNQTSISAVKTFDRKLTPLSIYDTSGDSHCAGWKAAALVTALKIRLCSIMSYLYFNAVHGSSSLCAACHAVSLSTALIHTLLNSIRMLKNEVVIISIADRAMLTRGMYSLV